MQSFRERSGFRGNQHCHQQEPYELSRLENYRHHHSQNRQGYEAHSLTVATAAAAAGAGAKDCYGQQAYPGYGSNSALSEKQYKGGKNPSQHLQGGYSSHLNTAYSTQYINDGHLQQKWEDSSHVSQYEQNMLGRLESTGRAGGSRSQFLPQNMLAISQNQCPHASQPSTPVYTSHHQQKLPQDTTPSAMTYTHGHLHFPQHTQSLATSTPSYIEKCNTTPHCYKGYPMPPNSQYSRQPGNNNSLKQSSYRSQNNYAYQQPPSRTGYEQQSPLQGIPSTQDSLSKYQHFSQPQQNYCLSDISVRSPEQYYQNCSPNASHSPARSVGRSPSYNPTSSPLMVNSETFLYSQPPITSGASSSSTIQEQGLHMPQQSHTSPSINHQTTSYAGSLKDKFSEKLLSNPSLWSLNVLTSQVENISNNVQQLLLSEALIANKKGKRTNPKQGEEFKGQLHTLEDSSCLDTQHTAPVPEAFSTPQTIQTGLEEGRCSNNSEDQQERSYYYYGQNTSAAQATTNPQLTLDVVPSCVMTSPNDMSSKSAASHRTAQAVGDNLNTILKELSTERSPISIDVPGSLNQEQNSPAGRECLGDSAKENFEESAWSEKLEEKEREEVKEQLFTECEKQADVTVCKQEEEWAGEGKCLSVLHKISNALSDNNYPNDKDEKIYQDLVQDYSPADGDISERLCNSSDISFRRDTGPDEQPEMYKSEFPPDSDATGKRVPFVWGDEYLTMKEDDSELPRVSSNSELFEDRLSAATKERLQALEEQHSVLSSQAAEVSKEESLPSSEEVINNITWSLESGEFLSPGQEQGIKSPANADTEVQDADFTSSEKRSVICDIAPLTNSVKTVFSVFNEEATPLSQARDHIDRCEAAVLEPESPQLPGKSMMHSAPSWADTPPSPKKGDEEIDPGISCPSAVTPLTKSEPIATSANHRVFNRKHVRGRRRQPGMMMHTSVRIRRLSSVEGDSVPAPPLEMGLPSSKAMVFVEQAMAAHKDISSQTPTLLTENFPSRMCTRSFTAMATPKTCLHLKRRGEKPSKGGVVKDSQGDPKGLISKIKWSKQRGPKPVVIGHRKGRRGLSENRQQDENQETTLCLSPCVRAQRPMVLRSRKQTQDNPPKEKAKERKTMCILPKALKEMKRQRTACLKEQDCVSSKQNLASVHRKGVYRTLLSKSDKNIPSIKRKSSCHSPVSVKKQKGVKGGKPEIIQPPLKTKLMGVKGPKRKLMQGENFNIPMRSFLAKDPSPASINDVPCISPQYPAKTKYLPPRKGRGLKYEAMVQKITSPGSKKHIAHPQVENVQGNLTSRTAPQSLEQVKMVEPGELRPEQQEITQSMVGTQDSTVAKASVIKQRNGLPTDSGDQPELVSGTEGLVINTPRLAKQRAIKNNHEMHLKQSRKRRKGLTPLESTGIAEQQIPTPTSACPAGEQIGLPQTPTHMSLCKKERRAMNPTKKRQAKALGKQGIKNKTIIQKTGPTRRNTKHLHKVKPTKNGRRLKTRHRLKTNPVVEGQQPEICLKYVTYKPPKNENKPFSPFVYIDSSEEFASFCAIINKPEEELLLQSRDERFPKIQNPVIVSKVIPSSSVMLQGPLVNKNLIDRCLTCCLCGKPANYRELGDLCGPYYPEDSIPRKALSFKYKLESRDEGVTVNCSAVQASTPKREGLKSLSGGSSSTGRPGRPKKAEKVSGESVTIRPKFLERYKKLQQFQSYERRVGEQEAAHLRLQDDSGTVLQKLDLGVEAKENWVHEACAVWTSGVFLVAGKLYGLEEAMNAAAQMRCSKCQDVGASVSCCSKGCHQKFHYVCAKETGCLLLEESLSLKCTEHKPAL